MLVIVHENIREMLFNVVMLRLSVFQHRLSLIGITVAGPWDRMCQVCSLVRIGQPGFSCLLEHPSSRRDSRCHILWPSMLLVIVYGNIKRNDAYFCYMFRLSVFQHRLSLIRISVARRPVPTMFTSSNRSLTLCLFIRASVLQARLPLTRFMTVWCQQEGNTACCQTVWKCGYMSYV